MKPQLKGIRSPFPLYYSDSSPEIFLCMYLPVCIFDTLNFHAEIKDHFDKTTVTHILFQLEC